MKKALLLLILAVACTIHATAQNVILGERVPEVKVTTWLSDSQPTTTELTYIEFYHSSNPSCVRSLDLLKTLANQMDGRLRVLIITHEKQDKVESSLNPYISDRIGVGLDVANKLFTNFGVSYVPFGVLVDAKNRALWMGNTLQLTPALIEKISQ